MSPVSQAQAATFLLSKVIIFRVGKKREISLLAWGTCQAHRKPLCSHNLWTRALHTLLVLVISPRCSTAVPFLISFCTYPSPRKERLCRTQMILQEGSRQHSLLWRNIHFHSTFSLVTSQPFQWTLGHPRWLQEAAPQLQPRGCISSQGWFPPGPGKQSWARGSPDGPLMPARMGGGNSGLNEPVNSRGGAEWKEQRLTSALRDAKHRVVRFPPTWWVAGASILAAISCSYDIGPGNFPAAGGSQPPDHLVAFNNIRKNSLWQDFRGKMLKHKEE